MFTKAIVRRPCKNMINGITTSTLGAPDFNEALQQHDSYIKALENCGLKVTVLEADENHPDSVFVEDTAVLTKNCAIIANPGAESRNAEIIEMKEVIKDFYTNIEEIQSPGILDGGDIMQTGDHFYIGLSDRTNEEGAKQFIEILNKHKMSGSIVELEEVLHLKTGVVYLENNNLAASGEFLNKPEFNKFNILKIDDDESYSANCIWVNDRVIVPLGFPKSKRIIENAGYETVEVDVSEYRKLDGGLSCLSLRF